MFDSYSKGIEFESVLSGSVFITASPALTLRFKEWPPRWRAAVNVRSSCGEPTKAVLQLAGRMG
jgi:hypothetical protein